MFAGGGREVSLRYSELDQDNGDLVGSDELGNGFCKNGRLKVQASRSTPIPTQLEAWVRKRRAELLTSNCLNGIQISTLTLSQHQRNGISGSSRRSPCDIEWCTSSDAGQRCECKWVLSGRKSSDGREDEGC